MLKIEFHVPLGELHGGVKTPVLEEKEGHMEGGAPWGI